MSRQYRRIAIARLSRPPILGLKQVPVALLGAVKVVSSGTKKPAASPLEKFSAVADRTPKFKHGCCFRNRVLFGLGPLFLVSTSWLRLPAAESSQIHCGWKPQPLPRKRHCPASDHLRFPHRRSRPRPRRTRQVRVAPTQFRLHRQSHRRCESGRSIVSNHRNRRGPPRPFARLRW